MRELNYETISRESLQVRLEADGAVFLRLSSGRGKGACRLLRTLEFFRDGHVRDRLGKARIIFAVARGVWDVAVVTIFYPKLIDLAPFFILDKPHVWESERQSGGEWLVSFIGRQRQTGDKRRR